MPTLYTALTSGDLATDATVYGTYTHSFVLERGQTVQIVVDNADTGKHPFHLHGHAFQAVWRSEENAGLFADSNATSADFPATPMRRDTFVLYPQGNIVLRFKADNPGESSFVHPRTIVLCSFFGAATGIVFPVSRNLQADKFHLQKGIWLFHCHIEWHIASGLTATMVEAPLDLQRDLVIPSDHYEACAAASPSPIPTAGNAAANTQDLLDLTGQPSPPGTLPPGFTARGIVALVFSCVSGILGTAVVAWYGLVGEGEGAAAGSGVGAAGAGEGVLRQQVSGGSGGQEGVEQITVNAGGAGAVKT